MTWDEPATRSSAGPRVIEPPKPEDRFGREDTREPDLFSSLTPPPRSNRSAPQESPARPKSPSSVLARASADSAAESTVDLDVPTFDRRGVRPPVDAPRSARTQSEPPRLEPEILGEREPALFEPAARTAHRAPAPPPAPIPAAPPAPTFTATPPPASPAHRAEPMRSAPELDAFEDDDLPLHSSSSDPGALDTIAYLTNELAGDIAAFEQRPTRPRASTTTDPYASSRPARTWMDTAETQLDDAAPPPRGPADDLDFDLEDEPLETARTAPAIDFGTAPSDPVSTTVPRGDEPLVPTAREAAWALDPAELAGDLELDPHAADFESSDVEAADPDPSHRPAFATFVIERTAPAATEPPPAEEGTRAGDGAARGAERATIDWDELRAARARDWAAFDAQAPPPPVAPRAPRLPDPEPVAEPPRRAVPFREPPRVEPRVNAREVTRDLDREAPRAVVAPVVTPPPSETRIEPPPSRWLDTEPARAPRRGWNDVAEPDLLDDIDETADTSAEGLDEVAPFTGRAIAFAVDAAIVASTAVIAVLLGVIAFGTTDYQAIDFVRSFQVLDDAFNLLLALIGVVYFSVSHAWTGATLGKAMVGLKVVGPDGQSAPSVGRSLVRTVAYVASSLLGIGFLWALRKPHRAWHDYAAGTTVVRTKPSDSL